MTGNGIPAPENNIINNLVTIILIKLDIIYKDDEEGVRQ